MKISGDVVRSAIGQEPPVIPGRLKIEITESECMNRPDWPFHGFET